MNCEEVQRCAELFRDSELDAKVTLEIQCHLADCAICRRKLEREETVDRQIAEWLRSGPRTERLWEKQEALISAAFRRRAGAQRQGAKPVGAGRTADLVRWRELLWPHPKLYAGAVACWGVMLLAQGQLGESRPRQEPKSSQPSPLVMMAVMEQREALTQLLGFGDKKGSG